MTCEDCINNPEADCWCHKCSKCGSTDTMAYDDGDDYPPNILCNNCENWD